MSGSAQGGSERFRAGDSASPYEAVIGLEIHAQLLTNSKLFCSCSTLFGNPPNTNICPLCTGQPGTLPVLNKKAVEFIVKTGLALGCKIREKGRFARKNYFYPDLPKGYQISQFDEPVCEHGFLEIEVDGSLRKIGITRIHLEEDAGKLVHIGAATIAGSTGSYVDLNRTGVALMEIVSEPDIRSAEEAQTYVEKLRHILIYLGVSAANMEEGNLRCDANVSVRKKGATEFGTRSELKNMNSLRSIRKGIEYEIERQIGVVEGGGRVIQETRHFDEAKGQTISLRSKEQAHDYRYFPEPDLVPLQISKAWMEEIRKTIPELPIAKEKRFTKDFAISADDAEVLVADLAVASFFEETVKLSPNAKTAANWIVGPVAAYSNEKGIALTLTKLTPALLAELIALVEAGTINGTTAKEILPQILESGKSPKELVEKSGKTQISDEGELKAIIQKAIADNPKSVEDFKAGKQAAIGFLMGQVMKATGGRANAKVVQQLLKDELSR